MTADSQPPVQATSNDLIASLTEQLGQLTVSQTWLELQLSAAHANVAALAQDRDAWRSIFHNAEQEWRGEREQLLARLRQLEPTPPTGPTPRRGRKPQRRT